jgi:hypothetical protein
MSMRVILCVPGSEADQWRHAAQGAFDVVKATTWAEALAAAAAYDDGYEPRIRAVGFMSMDLGGHSDLSVSARARAVIDAIFEYRALDSWSQ